MKEVDPTVTTRLLPYLEAGLASTANSEQFAGALMVATQLAARTKMGEPLVEALLEGIAKGTRVPLHSQALQAMLALCQTQRVKALPERAFKHLVKIPELEELVADLEHSYRADAFSIPLMRSLAEFADVHSNYERVLRGVIEKVPLTGKHFIAALPVLLQTAKKSTAAADMAKSVLKLADQCRPVATSEAVDFIFRGAAAKSGKDKTSEKVTKKKEKMVASEEDAAFLRDALLGSAAGPMIGHAMSIHAALDHPNASLRENAIAQLAQLSKDKGDGGEDVPSSLKNGSALGPAMLRRVSDDDPRVAAAAMDLDSLRRMVSDDVVLFAAAKARLSAAMTAIVAGSPNSDGERRLAKRALRLTIGVLSKSLDHTAPSALAGRAAALAYEYVLFSTTPALRNVTKSALNAARSCPHPALDGIRSDSLKSVAEDSKSSKDGDERRMFEEKCNQAVLSALAESLASDWGTGGDEHTSRVLWLREVYRDATGIGRMTFFIACKLAIEKTSGKSTAAASALRAASWAIIRDSWNEAGVGQVRGVQNDEIFPADALPDSETLCKLVSSDSAARKFLPSCHRSVLRAVLASTSKKSSVDADEYLSESFELLATTEAKDTKTGRMDDAFDARIGELLREVLNACDRCYGAAGSSAFLASKFASDPSIEDARVQVAALELCTACSKLPPIAPVIVAAASSASPVRAAAAALLSAYARDKKASNIVKSVTKAAEEIALKGATALCRAIEDGVNAAKSPSDELAAYLEPVQEMTSETRPAMDAYGARCLVATTRGLGDATTKASILLPVLSWCLQTLEDDSKTAKAALMVEIMNVYTPELAKSFGKDGGEGWAILSRCMVAPSPSAVRTAAFNLISGEFVAALNSGPKSQLLKILFSAVNADTDDISRREAQNAVDALTIDAKDVVKTLNAALADAPTAPPSKKKGKKADDDAHSSLSLGSSETTQAAATSLEVLAWKLDKTDNLDTLVEPCQNFLEAMMNDAAARAKARETMDEDSDFEESDDDEAGVAAGGYLEALALRTLESLALAKVGGKQWNVPLIIRAVREVDEGAARSAALACLAQIAHTKPEAVLSHVFDIGSALSARAAANDDVLSQRALESALVAVVPVWLQSGESLMNVVSRLIDSLPHAPTRRRAPICAALVRAAPPGEALPAIILNLIRRSKSLESSAREARAPYAAAVDTSDLPVADDDAWVAELLDALLVRETPISAVNALVDALKVRTTRSQNSFQRRSCRVWFSMMKDSLCQDSDSIDETYESAAFLLRNRSYAICHERDTMKPRLTYFFDLSGICF